MKTERKVGYVLHESGNNWSTCKILKEYETKEKARKEKTWSPY